MKAILPFLTSLLMAFGIANAGQTYFVSPTGDDTHDGRTEVTAWRSVSKVNATVFAPGDIVSFQRDGAWHEPLKPALGGAVS